MRPISAVTLRASLSVFRTLDNGDLGVMSILHEKMDMAVRLREDLAALDAKGRNSD